MAPTRQRRMRLDPTKKLIFRYGPEVDGFRTLRHNHAEVGHLPSPRNCLRKFVRSLGICQKTTFAPCRWNCRTAVRKSFHKCWFLMGDDSPCRLIPFHPGFSQLSRHHISHRDTKEHACRFSTCTWAVTQWVCQKHHLLRVHKISKIRLKEARPPGEAGNTGFDPSTAD
jgi:hypothetical protein